MKERSAKSPARCPLPCKRLEKQRFGTLFKPANSNRSNTIIGRSIHDGVELHEDQFVETTQAFDAALLVLITVTLNLAIVVELLIMLPITREGMRGLAILLN